MSDNFVYVSVKCTGKEHKSYLRLDQITEVHPLTASSAPFGVRGSRVHLGPRREVEVVTPPWELIDAMQEAWRRSQGVFDSSEDGVPEAPQG